MEPAVKRAPPRYVNLPSRKIHPAAPFCAVQIALALDRISRISKTMRAPSHSRTFKSGNSEAVRLPKGLGFGIGAEIVVERQGENVILRPAKDAHHVRRVVKALLADLEAIGRPDDGVQARPDFEAPHRPDL